MRLAKMYTFYIAFVLMLDPLSITAVRLDSYFCGFEQKCTENRTLLEQKMSSCCRPCECADICKEKGTCCGDKAGLDDTEVVMSQQCIPAAYMPELLPPGSAIQSYYTRTRCPGEFKDLAIKDKCESGKPESLEDVIFVSSEDGTVVYKNKFCGLCHGDENTVPWNIMLPVGITMKCFDLSIMLNLTAVFAAEYLLTHCTIEFIKPNSVALRTVLCFDGSNVISECNKTGMWEVYDSRLENLCLHPPESVYYYNNDNGWVFGNLYCYLCNMKATVVPEDCQDRFSRFTNKPLINILNPEVWTEPGNKKILEKTCNDDQILDTFFDVCRKLYCPIFSLSINGRCVPFLDPDVSYELFVRLLPLERIKASQSVKNELGSRYLNIQRKLGFGECKSCSVTMYLNKDALNEVHLPDVYVNFAFKVTRRCKVEQLWSKLTSVEKSSSRIKITLNKEVVSFDALWDNKTYKTFESDYYEEILTVGVSGQCKVLSPQRLANCPKVELTRKEYDTVLENHSGAKGLLFSPSNEETNGSVFVCCDSYIQEQRATGAEKRAPVLLTIIAYFFAVSMTTL